MLFEITKKLNDGDSFDLQVNLKNGNELNTKVMVLNKELKSNFLKWFKMKTKRVHSTSVVIEDAGVMITGKSGFGKSDLALRLIDSGATLISDDITICEKIGKSIFLFPPNETKGLLEVREIGIMTVPYIENIKLTLLVELVEKEIDRLPKQTFTKLMNTKIQKIKIKGKNSSSVAKIKLKINEINDYG